MGIIFTKELSLVLKRIFIIPLLILLLSFSLFITSCEIGRWETTDHTDDIAQKEDNFKDGTETENRILDDVSFTILYPGIVVRTGNPEIPEIALTFDDGPDDVYTPEILDILKEHDVKATFFVTGVMMEQFRDVAVRIHEEGHLMASHGYDHVNFTTLSEGDIIEDLRRNAQLIQDITGETPTFFRPPYAALNSLTVETIAEKGYSIVLWDVDSLDWKSLSKEEVLGNVLPYSRSGSIILKHSAGYPPQELSGAIDALPVIIKTLKTRGYQFARIDDMITPVPHGGVTQWYTVQPGDTLSNIAMRHSISQNKIMQLNPALDPNFLYPGQRLVITGEPIQNSNQENFHIVLPKDTLWKISMKYGVPLEQLKELNPQIDGGFLKLGEKILLE